jgi:hypothetical protein
MWAVAPLLYIHGVMNTQIAPLLLVHKSQGCIGNILNELYIQGHILLLYFTHESIGTIDPSHTRRTQVARTHA